MNLDTAMILAAGRGERMRPITDSIPKPLIPVNGKALIVRHIEKLCKAGFKRIVINHAWLGHKIEEALGDGSSFGVHIYYSPEIVGGLETAGGIRHALHLLGDTRVAVINGDIYTEFDYSKLQDVDSVPAWMYMVPNPQHNLKGDFSIAGDGRVLDIPNVTFSGIALYKTELFRNIPDERAPLRPYFKEWMSKGLVKGSMLNAFWCDVGTPERLKEINLWLKKIE